MGYCDAVEHAPENIPVVAFVSPRVDLFKFVSSSRG